MPHCPTLRLRIVIVAAAVIWVAPACSGFADADDKLAEIRRAVREESKDGKTPKSEKNWTREFEDDCDDDDDESLTAQIFGPIVFTTIGAPFLVPHYALEDSLYNDTFFPIAPYDETPGYLIIDPLSSEGMRGWAGRVTGQYGDNFGDISHWAGRLQLDSQARIGFDGEWYARREELPGGESDQFWSGDANLTFRFAQSEIAQFHAGLGANWLTDDAETDFGFNFTYGVDLFPVEPWVISSSIDWGRLGHAGLFHFRGTAGLLIRNVEVFGGYDLFRIDKVNINSLIAGVRIWF